MITSETRNQKVSTDPVKCSRLLHIYNVIHKKILYLLYHAKNNFTV